MYLSIRFMQNVYIYIYIYIITGNTSLPTGEYDENKNNVYIDIFVSVYI